MPKLDNARLARVIAAAWEVNDHFREKTDHFVFEGSSNHVDELRAALFALDPEADLAERLKRSVSG